MNNSIFNKTFDEIFTKERLYFASDSLFSDKEDFFSFAPHKKFLLPKDEGHFRQINIPDQKVKIIQKILLEELSYFFKFSNRNYAYQKNKSPIKAINRLKNLLNHHNFILRGDVKDFFDTIDHEILLEILNKKIADKKILYLFSMFLKSGTLFYGKWEDKYEGIYQGDIISPFLANIYLDSFDKYFEQKFEFIRFADDLIFLTKTYNEAQKLLESIKEQLDLLKLKLNEEKTFIQHKGKPFTFLGVRFNTKNNIYSIDNDRLMKKIGAISQQTKQLDLEKTIEKLNQHIDGFSRYYLQVINDKKQFSILQQREDEILIDKIIKAKTQKKITNKQTFIKILQQAKSYIPQKNYPYFLAQTAYEKIKLQDPLKAAQQKIAKQKQNFLKNQLKTTELIISKTGSYLSYYQGKIKLKTKDEPFKQFPIKKIKRIIITNKSTSISNYLIFQCAKEKIDIDFIDQEQPYALLTYYQTISNELHKNQLELFLTHRGLIYAKNLIFAKIKNQKNLLKYYNYRRKDVKIQECIAKITSILEKIKYVEKIDSLLGYEGQVSTIYWKGFAHIANLDSFTRTHQNSQDVINQALNYAYAIIYNKVQSSLIHQGLNIYYSFLHIRKTKEPTLVFDMIEPFRQPIVDREIISIITKKQHLQQANSRLDNESKKIIIQHIQERLASKTKTKYGKVTYQNLIELEAHSLKRVIENEEQKHKFFIAKY